MGTDWHFQNNLRLRSLKDTADNVDLVMTKSLNNEPPALGQHCSQSR